MICIFNNWVYFLVEINQKKLLFALQVNKCFVQHIKLTQKYFKFFENKWDRNKT